MNKIFLLGRLVEDPSTRYTQNNIAMTRFKLAVNRQGKPQDGQPNADFIQVTAWRATAEFVSKYFRKGQQVLIEGYLRNNNWTDKDGNKRYADEVHAEHVYFADSKRDSGGQGYQPQTQPAEQGGFYDLDNTEDLPF